MTLAIIWELLRIRARGADLCGKAGPAEVGQAAVQSLRQHPRQDLVHRLQCVHGDAFGAGDHNLQCGSRTLIVPQRSGKIRVCRVQRRSRVCSWTAGGMGDVGDLGELIQIRSQIRAHLARLQELCQIRHSAGHKLGWYHHEDDFCAFHCL